MGLEEFAELAYSIFEYRVATTDGAVTNDENPLDDLVFAEAPDEGVVVEWSGTPEEDIPNLKPLFNLADREGMRLSDRELEFTPGGQTRTGTKAPEMKERLFFVDRE